ncbi:MAG: anaerobic sulfatase maturase, partial [Planctomycetota bacterium]
HFRMSDEVLESFIRQYIQSQPTPEIAFAWQGGEPTLLGVDFFRKAVELQQRYAPPGKKIVNALQTNATRLTDEWCQFFRENNFLLGVSLDGDATVHDRYRVDKAGRPTHRATMDGLGLLKKHGVEFNLLTVVSRANASRPKEVYRFLKEHGSGFLQFIPLVERDAPAGAFATPPGPAGDGEATGVSRASVPPEAWGNFLIGVFDEWVRQDVGRVFVQYFDCLLGAWLGLPASLCVFSATCGRALALEHNGDLYACDHYVYPEYRLGNIRNTPLVDLVRAEAQERFGRFKEEALPRLCRECDVLFACRGECPKHRFTVTPEGEPGLSYLCAGLKRFLRHIDPAMRTMAALVKSGRPAAEIMALASAPPAEKRPGRNAPCPCGRGLKFKQCHGR